MHATTPSKFLYFFVKTGFHHVPQAGLKPLTSSDLLALASQSAGIDCRCERRAWPIVPFCEDGVDLLFPGARGALLVWKYFTRSLSLEISLARATEATMTNGRPTPGLIDLRLTRGLQA